MSDVDRKSLVSQKRKTLQPGQEIPVATTGEGLIFKRADYQLFCKLDGGEFFPVEAGSKILRAPGGHFTTVTLKNVANAVNNVDFYAFTGNVDFILNLLTGFVPSLSLDLNSGDTATSILTENRPAWTWAGLGFSFFDNAPGVGTIVPLGIVARKLTLWHFLSTDSEFNTTGGYTLNARIEFMMGSTVRAVWPINCQTRHGNGATLSNALANPRETYLASVINGGIWFFNGSFLQGTCVIYWSDSDSIWFPRENVSSGPRTIVSKAMIAHFKSESSGGQTVEVCLPLLPQELAVTCDGFRVSGFLSPGTGHTSGGGICSMEGGVLVQAYL